MGIGISRLAKCGLGWDWCDEETSYFSTDLNFLELRYSLWKRFFKTLGNEPIIIFLGSNFEINLGDNNNHVGINFHGGFEIFWFVFGMDFTISPLYDYALQGTLGLRFNF